MKLRIKLGFVGVGLCSVALLTLQFLGEVDISQFITQVAVGLFLLGIGIGYWTFKPEIEKHLGKDSGKTIEKVIIMESLADKQKDREKYANHLRDDTLSIIKLGIGNVNEPEYSEAIRSVNKNKKMILQHMYTYENVGISSPLYTRYKQIHSIDNRFKNSSFKVNELIYKLRADFLEIHLNKQLETMVEIDYDKLLNVLGFPQNVDLYSDSFDLNLVQPIYESNISEAHFYIKGDNGDGQYHIKYNNITVARCKSKKLSEKSLQLILKHSSNIVKLTSEIKMQKNMNEGLKHAFNEMFTHVSNSLEHGEPNLGVCDACIEFFPYELKDKYQKYLAHFNLYPIFWSDEFWE